MKIGFTIGKFAPFHKGHEYLIEKALQQMDKFYVVVYDTPEFEIDISTKLKWMQKKFPQVCYIKAFNSPKQYGLDKESVAIQMEYLSKKIEGIAVTHFFSSEEYGKYVADYLGIQNVLIDPKRENYPISAEKIRNNMQYYKEFLDSDVYQEMEKQRSKV